jgi:mannose-6-phosphate isomerase-like protein (cupin superfamily)
MRRMPSGADAGMVRRYVVAAMAAAFSIAVVYSMGASADARASTGPPVSVRTLAEDPVTQLPAANVFVAVLDFRQVPGAACGPTCGLPGFVYTLRGIVTVGLPGVAAQSISSGRAAFTPGAAALTNDKLDGRVGAGIIAVGLIVLVALLCAATWLRGPRRGFIIGALSLLLIGEGALVLSGATSNEWYFFAVRPAAHLSQPMPRPDGRVTFASAYLDPVPAAPYIERLRAITVPPGARYDADNVNGADTLIVLEGTASVHIGVEAKQLGRADGALAQAGKTLAIINAGSDTLKVLDFEVAPLSVTPSS